MSKNQILTLAAFGGIILISIMLNKSSDDQVAATQGVNNSPTAVTVSSEVLAAFPIYPGAKIERSSQSESEKSRDVSLSLSAKATITDVNKWYREALGQNGWSIKSDKNVAGYQILQGEKDNLYTSTQVANGDVAEEVVISQLLKIRK